MQPLSYVESYGGKAPGTGNRWSFQAESVPRLVVVIHTSEQANDIDPTDDADQLMRALQRPGTSGGPGKYYGSGYHAVTDLVPAGYHQIAPWHARTNSVPPLNSRALHVCVPERVSFSRTEWIDSGHVIFLARFIIDAHKTYGIPYRRLFVNDLKGHLGQDGHYNGPSGYCGHKDVSLAYALSDHTDPYPNFPWDYLDALLVHPAPNPDPDPDPVPLPPIEVEDDDVLEFWYNTDNPDKHYYALYVGGGKIYNFKSVPSMQAVRLKAVPKIPERKMPPEAFDAMTVAGAI